MELALFFLLALTAIVSAALMILQKNAVHSAIFLILNFGCVALLFLMLDAPFISMVQIAVYAGAIMVLFLFVIMLLGAEQTTDTESRQFGWLTTAATILGASFLFAMAIPLVFAGGLDLPESPGEAPYLRLIHAANVQEPVNISVGETQFEDVRFRDTTGFNEFEAGDYDVTITDSAGNSLLQAGLTLANDQVLTAVAYGVDGVESVVLVPSDLDSSEDNMARVAVVNLLTQSPLFLVDLGADRQLDVEADAITDNVLTDALGYGELAEFTIPDGSYNLRFVSQQADGEFVIESAIGGQLRWDVEEATEQTLIISPDYASIPDDSGAFRPTVIATELQVNEPFGAPGDIGAALFIDYLLPVNLVGFLLLVALIGVIVLTRPEGITYSRRALLNRRRKVSRPLVSVITQQTGRDVVVDTPKLDEPASGE